MRTLIVLTVLVLAGASLAGCMNDEKKNNTGNTNQNTGTTPSVSLGTLPATAVAAGSRVNLSWTVTAASNATVPHTAVHFGNVSHASMDKAQLTATTYPFATEYQSGTGSHADFMVPWEGNTTTPKTYYFRAHAVVNGQNVWSDEQSITVTASPTPYVAIVGAPGTVAKGTNLTVKWYVWAPTPGTTSHTAVHYGGTSHKELAPTAVTPTTYPSNAGVKTGPVPGYYTSTITAPNAAGDLYYRGHIIYNTVSYWTPEYHVKVTG